MINMAGAIQLFNRLWSGFAGVLLIFFIGAFTDVQSQGYFYTFQSLLSLQVFFEMGLAQVVLNVSSHEFALVNSKTEEFTKIQVSKLRLGEVIVRSVRWFRNAACLFLIITAPLGFFYFTLCREPEAANVAWQGPWFLACLFQAMILLSTPFLTLREASGNVAEVAGWRLIGEVFGYMALLGGLYSGFGLYSLVLLLFFRISVVAFFVRIREDFIFELYDLAKSSVGLNLVWLDEVVPFQKRMAISWISGYLLFSSMPAIIFAMVGPVASGRFGMTWGALMGVMSISLALVTVQIPAFAKLIANGEINKLKSLYAKVSYSSVFLLIIGLILLVLVVITGDSIGWSITHRFMSIPSISILGVVIIINQISFTQATLVRARKTEPYVCLSLVGGIAQIVITVIGSYFWGIDSIPIFMAAWSLLVVLPWSTLIFNSNKPWA